MTVSCMKCSHCDGELEILTFSGSAIHTKCKNCNIVAQPISTRPPIKTYQHYKKFLTKSVEVLHRRPVFER